MAARGRKKLFEWKIIRIPYSTVKFWAATILILLVITGVGVMISKDLFHTTAVGRKVLGFVNKITASLSVTGSESIARRSHLRQRTAAIGMVRGRVEVQRAGDSWEKASKGISLSGGDRIRAYSDSWAEVRFDDGSLLNIKPDSLIIIKNLEEDVRTRMTRSAVQLVNADLEASIQKPAIEGSEFRIETSDSVATIRGKSHIQIRSTEDKGSNYRVLKGLVHLVSGSTEVEIGDLVAVSVSPDQTIHPRQPLPPAPNLVAPAALTTTLTGPRLPNQVVFTWSPPEGGGRYYLQVARDRLFGDLAYEKKGIKTNSFQVTNLEPGIYFWRVATQRGETLSGFSQYRPFRIVADQVPPLIEIEKLVVSRGEEEIRILLEGMVEPGVALMVDGKSIPVDREGRFSTVVTTSLEQENIVIEAEDDAGNENRLERNLGAS